VVSHIRRLVVNPWGIAADLGIGFGVGGTFQLLGDWNDPFLNNYQRASRVLVGEAGAALAGGIGLWVQYSIVAARGAGAATPAGWIGLTIGLVADYVIGEYVVPYGFELAGAKATRDLQKLR